jgi:hypothetical protein
MLQFSFPVSLFECLQSVQRVPFGSGGGRSVRADCHSARRMPSCPTGALISFFLVVLAGCNLGGHPQAAAPPPPKPAAVQQPAPEPPLSIPQTVVQLPSAQPVNPDAIPAPPAGPPPVPEKSETATSPRPVRRANPPKPAETEEETPPAASPAPTAEEPAPFQPILSGEEKKRIQDAIGARRHEIDERLTRAKGHLTDHDKSLVERINSFLTLAAQAAQRGDFTQADALSERALILARELQVE